jgi:hypothetical protein
MNTAQNQFFLNRATSKRVISYQECLCLRRDVTWLCDLEAASQSPGLAHVAVAPGC